MDLTEFDIVILITMTLAVVSMSFVFPALGLADVDASENDLPRYEVSADRFSFAGDRPAPPGTPTQVNLSWNGTEGAYWSDNQVWLNGGTSGGTELLLLPNSTNDDAVDVRVNVWSDGSVPDESTQTFDSDGGSGIMQINDYTLLWEATGYEYSNGNVTATVDVEIDEQPVSDGGWIGRIPVVGGLYGAGQATAATLGWFGAIAYWFVESTIQSGLNAIGVLIDVLSYLFGIITWLVSTYGAVITGAQSWVAIFVALPGILLSLVLAKIVMIGISLLPTT